MNIRIKVYKKLLTEICDKYDGVDDFINDRIEQLSAEEVIYFLVSFFRVFVFLLALLALK